MAKKNLWTATRIYQLLKQRFPDPAFVLLPQVRNATGYKKRERYADAVAVSVYPSRGVYLAGIEIKVSKSDWRKELSEPDKASAIQKYCRYWYVAAPAGVVPIDEVPEQWGLLECSGNSIEATKQAASTEPESPDILFVASVLRKASQNFISRDDHSQIVEQVRESDEQMRKDAARLVTVEHELERFKEGIQRFEKASGIQLSQPWRFGNIGQAVKDVVSGNSGPAVHQRKSLIRLAEQILETLGTSEQ